MLRRAQEVASAFDLPVMIHMGQTASPMSALVSDASRIYPLFRDRGTLNVGAPADIAILELREGEFEFVDKHRNVRTGPWRLFASDTVIGGRRAPRV